jgi:hypothetical protein
MHRIDGFLSFIQCCYDNPLPFFPRGGNIFVSPGIDPGYSRLPQSKKIMYTNIWCTTIM